MQRWRRLSQGAFFTLFLSAPLFDLFRYDLTRGHFYLLGGEWRLGIETVLVGTLSPTEIALQVLFRGLLPLLFLVSLFIFISWRYGRLYCGWLCPHFAVVEGINRSMLKAFAKPTLWENRDLSLGRGDRRWWLVPPLLAILVSFIWAVVLLTYLLPPAEIYANLYHASLTANQLRFISVATLLLSLEFLFARHLFCRFGCAVGMFQSLAWMANRRAMVIIFRSSRSSICQHCSNGCDKSCPMRLKPRSQKRRMFTCTQCGVCIARCGQTQQQLGSGEITLLPWRSGTVAADGSREP
ncbi:MAG: 4Fe-4S binding protein [Gammaproteobacteria bacterium]|nr:4Fe-4S binding protein [Gammaproteobacteria bacterium]